jgi:hypothetical protein
VGPPIGERRIKEKKRRRWGAAGLAGLAAGLFGPGLTQLGRLLPFFLFYSFSNFCFYLYSILD